MHRLDRIKQSLTYANVIATLALFIALGGTATAAATLARNSVGPAQIRANAVGTSELRRNAVTSTQIRDRTIALRDIAPSTRNALRGTQGPAGPQGPAGATGPAGTAEFAAINSGGQRVLGTARGASGPSGTNTYTVEFTRDVSACTYSATLAAVQNGPVLEQPPAGRITVASGGGTLVKVKTFDAAGAPAPAPFHLIVAC